MGNAHKNHLDQSLVPIEQLTGSRQEDLYVNFP
jgi:hypothetical protein